jgi:hypothetical protein
MPLFFLHPVLAATSGFRTLFHDGASGLWGKEQELVSFFIGVQYVKDLYLNFSGPSRQNNLRTVSGHQKVPIYYQRPKNLI